MSDDATGTGVLVRAQGVPASHRIDAWVAVMFPDSLLTVLTRGKWPQPAEGVISGRLEMKATEPLSSWSISCVDTALVFPQGASGPPAKGERHGAATQVTLDATFTSWMDAEGLVERATDVNAEGFVRVVSSGRFEQAGSLSGTLRAGKREIVLSGRGIRERAWGPGVEPGMTIGVAFDEGLAVSARAVSRDGRALRSGWIRAGSETSRPEHVRLEYAPAQGAQPASVTALLEHPGGTLELQGEVVATMPGREEGFNAVRCLVRFRAGDREALGFAEVIS